MSERKASDVLCAGIVVADHVCSPIDHLPRAGELVQAEHLMLTIGGCAANVAVDLARMQVPSMVIGKVGIDVLGRAVIEMLQQQGVDVSAIKTTAEADTSQTLIVNVQGEDRRFIHSFGANAHFTATDLSMAQVEAAKILYVGGYLVMPQLQQLDLAQVFEKAQKAGVKTVLDVVTAGQNDYLNDLEKLLPFVDCFLPNNDEAELITGKSEPLEQAKVFRDLGVKTCVITMGQHGSILVSEHEQLRADTFQVPVVDGSGGGDAFTAGFITGMLEEKSAAECLTLASALGASCVQSIGTTTGVFTRQQCSDFLQRQSLQIETV